MQREKLINSLLVVFFTAAFFATRVPGLSHDTVNPDAVNWHYRSEQFVVGLKTHQWEKTYQHYHPGVTLMWLLGSTVEVLRQLNPSLRVYNQDNFLFLDYAAKFVLVIVQLVLTGFLIHFLSKIFSFKKALLVASLFTFEPFFTGNSRLLHMDVLLALFLMNGLVCAYISTRQVTVFWTILSGVFLALAFLTKSVAVLGFAFALLTGSALIYFKRGWRRVFNYAPVLSLAFISTVFLLFPALWSDFFGVVASIFAEAERIGIRKGHDQIFFGGYSRDPGLLFYPLVFLLKISPFLLFGAVLHVLYAFKFKMANTLSGVKKKDLSLMLFLLLFYASYVLLMSIPTKKIDRYMISVYPFLALFAVSGFHKIISYLKGFLYGSLFTAFGLLTYVLPIFTYYPYYFTYTSPLFGSAQNANKIIGQKPFGIGIPALKDFILNRYDSRNCMKLVQGVSCFLQFTGQKYPRLGFIDTKPMKAIYPSSKVFDVRVNGTSDYDILVLGPNEETPQEVLEGERKFIYDTSMYINGLEFWRLYVKEGIPSK